MTTDLFSTLAQIESYVQQHLSRYLDELRTWCSIDTGTENKNGLDELARLLAARGRTLSMTVKLFEHEQWGCDVLATYHGQGRTKVVLLGHIDTVYPVGTASARPLMLKGQKVYGPGVCDMKGAILAAIYTLEAIAATDALSTLGEISLLCVSDEETNHRHSAELIMQVCQGCQEVLVLEAARENGDIVSARKGTAWYTLQAKGRSAHAGVEPEKGRNAILELSHQVLQFHQLQGWCPGLTINPGTIVGGTVQNVVPDFACVGLDLRFVSAADRIDTEQRWRAMLCEQYVSGVETELSLDGYCDPMTCTVESMRVVCQALEIARRLNITMSHTITGGSSDARYPASLGLPVLDGLGPVGGMDHSPDEYILLDSIAPRVALLAGLLLTAEQRYE